MIRLYIKGIAYDINSNPIILLTNEQEDKVLPIWVGILEAHSIAMAIEGAPIQRPMTHDLIFNILHDLGVSVASVVISDIKENTFHAELHLSTPGGEKVIDSRPSDAIALALRSSAPVYLNDKLFTNMFKMKDLFDDEIRKDLDKFFNSDAFKEHKKSLH
ncbi:MAG: bifunctional nuclease family protein [Peptococcaceae bacterium]|nr:bifunctional nuclease family protein [Peptococcaceae bacterium]